MVDWRLLGWRGRQMVGNSHGSLEGMWEGAGGRLEAVRLEGVGGE